MDVLFALSARHICHLWVYNFIEGLSIRPSVSLVCWSYHLIEGLKFPEIRMGCGHIGYVGQAFHRDMTWLGDVVHHARAQFWVIMACMVEALWNLKGMANENTLTGRLLRRSWQAGWNWFPGMALRLIPSKTGLLTCTTRLRGFMCVCVFSRMCSIIIVSQLCRSIHSYLLKKSGR